MNLHASSVSLWSYGLAAFGYLAFAAFNAADSRSRRQIRQNRWMLVALILCGLWSAFGLAFVLSRQVLFLHSHLLLDTLRYLAWYACLLSLFNPGAGMIPAISAAPAGRGRALVAVGGIIGLIGLTCQGLLFVGAGPYSALTIRIGQFNGLAMTIFALSLVEQVLRNTPSEGRWNLKPLALGLASVFMFDLYLYSSLLLFGAIDDDLFAARGIIHAMIIPLLAVAAKRMGHREGRLAVSQAVAFHTATLVVAGIYLLGASAAGYYVRYFGGTWGGALQLMLLFAAVLTLGALAISGSMRARVRVLVGKHFFRYRYDYREEWLKFTRTLSADGAPQEVGQRLVRGLADLVESPAGSLWLDDGSGRRFVQSARWNGPEIAEAEAADSPMCRFLWSAGWVVNLEEYRHMPGRYADLALPPWLTGMPNAWLVVPLTTAERMVGFVVLTTARTALDVNWEVNDLLKTAGRQAASFIAQIQATEALLEARKFDAFNRMSAFVVHDLKNIITQLSLLTRNAERHFDNPEFQKDMLLTVQNSVERMRQLMLQLREGATPPGVACGVDLADIVRRIERAKSGHRPRLELRLDDTPTARGHEERIERVIGHMVQNALDATPADGAVTVRLAREEGMACIEVSDTGKGMTAEFIRERLFKPFQTTKQAGMGIGAYESYQYVQELGGKVQVDSTPGVGTRIRMLLPLFNLASGSDLQRLEAA